MTALKEFLRLLPDDEARGDFAKRCGTTAGHLRNVSYGQRPAAAALCASVERESLGAVPCEVLREDLAWRRIPDRAWKWHPNGRPVLDVAHAGSFGRG